MKKIFIYAPANTATGGPELLHQFGVALKEQGHQVTMVYHPKVDFDPVHENYKSYGLDWSFDVEDSEDNILVLPEVYVSLMKKFKDAKKILWWLSVDNYYKAIRPSYKRKIARFYEERFGKLASFLFQKKRIEQAKLHLVQCEYARQHLVDHGINKEKILDLSDFLHESFLEQKTDLSLKENIICYNPVKGKEYTDFIMESLPGYKYIPIQNMTRDGVADLLKKSKIYIDFGTHPGKDRIPREAAHLGCVVITNKQGSAAFQKDLPIPEKYKISDVKREIDKLSSTFDSATKDYKACYEDFSAYRNIIKSQKSAFEEETNIVIEKLKVI